MIFKNGGWVWQESNLHTLRLILSQFPSHSGYTNPIGEAGIEPARHLATDFGSAVLTA